MCRGIYGTSKCQDCKYNHPGDTDRIGGAIRLFEITSRCGVIGVEGVRDVTAISHLARMYGIRQEQEILFIEVLLPEYVAAIADARKKTKEK